jgi:hypothetical protein
LPPPSESMPEYKATCSPKITGQSRRIYCVSEVLQAIPLM